MEKEEELNRLKEIDLNAICNNAKLGELNFKEILSILTELRDLFVELEELDYQNKLTEPEANDVNQLRKKFIAFLDQVESFDIKQANSSQIHQQYVTKAKEMRKNIWEKLRSALIYLRQEAEFNQKDMKELQEERKGLISERRKAEELNVQLHKELDDLRQQKKEVASAKGEVAALTFGKHFEDQAGKNDLQKDWWLKVGWKFSLGLGGIILFNFALFLVLFIGSRLFEWWSLSPSDFFTLEYGAPKFALLLLLSYAVGFSFKQYNINANLAATNKHRKNVAETLKDFYASVDTDKLTKEQIVKEGSQAMFQNLPIGHITKGEHHRDDGPIHKIINNVPFTKE